MDTVEYLTEKLEPGACFLMGKEGTWWRVLQVNEEERTALVIANKEICGKIYNKEKKDITWNKCALRKWLNGEYFEETFSDQEKEAILGCEIKTPDNVKYGTKGGAETKDKIWLLSIDEVNRYLKNDEDRATGEWWWLRSPGSTPDDAAYVHDDGSVDADGLNTHYRACGVRPVFLLNLNASFFKQMLEDEENLLIKVPELFIREGKTVSVAPNLRTVKIPEGVTEILSSCFVGMEKLQEVVLPSTLKKIGKEAFRGCKSLKSVAGTNGSISYGEDVFIYCGELEYTAEMFRNTGKLCDSFAYHMDNCGLAELAWVLMYQQGDVWDKESGKKITRDNAEEILDVMTEHIETAKKSPKKAAVAASTFITANCALLPVEKISHFCDALNRRKLRTLAEELKADSAVTYALGDPDQIQRIMPDGSIWYGKVEVPIAVGSHFCMGNGETFWRILHIDQEEQTAIVVANQEICEKAYNEEGNDITWGQCTLRHWLNGEYYEKTFSEEEKSAILECNIKTPDNSVYKTKGGADTKDKIWLLSTDEAKQYFKDATDRVLGCWGWWLRSPGDDQDYAAYVYRDGSISDYGGYVLSGYGVRPAFKINLKSEFFQSVILTNQEGKVVISNPALVFRNGALIGADTNVTEVSLPPIVREIKAGAFIQCRKLKNLTWEASSIKIDTRAFYHNSELKLPASFYLGSELPHYGFAEYAPAEPSVIANMLILADHYGDYRSQAVHLLSVNNAQNVAEEILRITAEMKPLESTDNIMRFLLAAFSCISSETTEKLCEFLGSYEENIQGIKIVRDAMKAGNIGKPDVVKGMFEISEKILKIEDRALKKIPNLLEILAATADYAEMYQVVRNRSRYSENRFDFYQKREIAETRAKGTDHAALMQLMKVWQVEVGDEWYAPYAAYADESELAELLKEMKVWMKDKNLEDRANCVREAIFLNDTNDAMRYADSMGLLGRYAALRGMDEETVRDSMMSDLGLDETGHKTWKLAGKSYLLTLNKDLTVTLTGESGKVLRSIPKRGADPDEYEAVNKEYTSLKKDIKPTAKLRNDKIFAAFLSGQTRNGAAWKKAYLKNPLLRLLGQLIVWNQGDHAFILKEDGKAYDADGNLYEITDEPIAVAHPLEMGEKLTKKWQDYFVSNDLKQPFEQVWEPVADPSLVKSGRYDKCKIPLYALMNKEKHGITVRRQRYIILKDCSASLRLVSDYSDWYKNDFEVYNFNFKTYTRQVNHVVAILDKATVADRIKKDDVSVEQWLDRFTPAQIREFVTLASENRATNVTALLLQYQSEHFETEKLDAFDEFTLDLL